MKTVSAIRVNVDVQEPLEDLLLSGDRKLAVINELLAAIKTLGVTLLLSHSYPSGSNLRKQFVIDVQDIDMASRVIHTLKGLDAVESISVARL